jgi:hypothetical protein
MKRRTSGCSSCGTSSRSTRARSPVSLQQTTASCGTVTVTEDTTGGTGGTGENGGNGGTGGGGAGDTPSDTGGLDTETAVILGGAALGAAFLVSRRQ